ncbi:MAG: Rieske (2Fe-2S) protein [Thiotrichales bacterium]
MSRRWLCPQSALDATRAKGLTIDFDGHPTDIFLVRDRDGSVHGYIDRCPHAGSPLAWRVDEYLDEDGEHIICGTHAALFRVHDGACRGGPCRRQGLTKLRLEIDDDGIHLTD